MIWKFAIVYRHQCRCGSIRLSKRYIQKYLHPKARLLCVDMNGLYAVFKPVNVLSHPNNSSGQEILKSIIMLNYNYDGEYFVINENKQNCETVKTSSLIDAVDENEDRIWLLNRIDSATSGIVLLTTKKTIALKVKNEFAARRVKKVYKSICFDQNNSFVSESSSIRIDLSAKQPILHETSISKSKSNGLSIRKHSDIHGSIKPTSR